MALAPGTALTAGLVLEREIGKGGMGAVWIAKNAALGSRVAVKVLHREGGGSSDEARRRFEQEARGLARLDHPNLVRIFDFGMTEDGDPFIVMELLRGEDLAQRLVQGPLDLALASSVLRQTCRALARAHDAGVIHRDIKPANIFLCESDDEVVVKVLDFGVARFEQGSLDSMTKTGALVGTPYFMSPEQHMNPKGIDHRSDLWSVAVVAFMCLTGTMPFTGETITQLGFAVLEGQRQKLRSIRPELPAALDIWMDRALAKDPAQRYQSAKELAEAFDRARSASPAHVPSAQAAPASARPTGPPSAAYGAPAAHAYPVTTQQPAASQVVPTTPSAGVGAANATATQPAAIPVVAAAAPPVKKSSMAPLLVVGGIAIAALTGGGVWLAMRGDSSAPAASASGKAKTAEATTSSAAPATAGTTAAPVQASQAAPPASAPPTATESAAPVADASTDTPSTPSNPTDHPTSTTPSAKPSASTAPTAVASTAPTAVESAAPSARSGSPASGVMAGCWKNNAEPGTPASSATASFTVDGNGKTSSIVISGPARSVVPNFAPCSVLGITSLNFGPGPAGPVTASGSFPAIKK